MIWFSDAAEEGGIDFLQTMTRMDITTDSNTPVNLANSIATATLSGGDYAVSAGDVSGRKCTVSAKPGLTATAGGTARHYVLSLGGVVHHVTTVNPLLIEVGGIVNVPDYEHEGRAPIAD